MQNFVDKGKLSPLIDLTKRYAVISKVSHYFTEHPSTVGESYFQHLFAALGFSLRMMLGGLACMVHAFFPFLCIKTGSKCIDELHEKMVTNRS